MHSFIGSYRDDHILSKNKTVDGQNVLYHYLQKNIMREDDDFSKELLKHLLTDLSIWIPINFYCRLPIILPYVVRDNSCRIKQLSGEDEWGAANSNGFLRDDNTLLKGIVRSFAIKSPKISVYNRKTLGTGFVTSHIWGKVSIDDTSMISSRHHMLNSFVPNLVWLPVQISKLTDREGSYAQKILQSISHNIYRAISMPKEISQIWEALPYPEDFEYFNVDLTKLNYFIVSDLWLGKRINGLVSEIDEILSVDKFDNSKRFKVKSKRYLPTLKQINTGRRKEINEWLSRYQLWLRS
jgi:hypothetical protein